MKKILITVFIACSLVTNSQTADNTESRDNQDVYFQSLKKYLIENKTSEIVYVELNSFTTNGLPENINGISIKYIGGRDIKKKAKKEKEFTLHRVIPLRMEDGIFFVNVIPYRVQCKGKTLDLKNMGGQKINFTYDCVNMKFIPFN